MMINVKPIVIYREEMLNIEQADGKTSIPSHEIDQFSVVYDKICVFFKNKDIKLFKDVKKAYFSENGINYTIYEEKREYQA